MGSFITAAKNFWTGFSRSLILSLGSALCFVLIIACTSSGPSGPPAPRDPAFLSPTRLIVDESGNIYVSDFKKGEVAVLDTEGELIDSFSGFFAPLGVAAIQAPPDFECPDYLKNRLKDECAGRTFLFVGDKGDGSVQVLVDGERSGVLGKGRREFGMPNAIAVASDLTVYVVDSKENQIKVYNSSGKKIMAFGDPGMDFPTDIAMNEGTLELYVTDFNNQRIRVYDFEGNLMWDIYAPLNDMNDPVFWKPAGIGIDDVGDLLVVDNSLSCVVKITRLGELLDIIGYNNGEYWTGELSVPIDATAFNNRIYVTSNRHREIAIFEVVP